jgi:hypothetical protein
LPWQRLDVAVEKVDDGKIRLATEAAVAATFTGAVGFRKNPFPLVTLRVDIADISNSIANGIGLVAPSAASALLSDHLVSVAVAFATVGSWVAPWPARGDGVRRVRGR